MNISRRGFFAQAGKVTALAALVATFPRLVWAKWNAKAFQADSMDAAINARYPGMSASDSSAITLKAPAIAENGAVVPISVSTDMPNVKSIAIFVEKNPNPLAAAFNMQANTVPDVSVRIRMGQTSNLIALVEADGKLHRVQQEVKVTIGGCGG
jgi:sulfur-oxidizing protein SoxY